MSNTMGDENKKKSKPPINKLNKNKLKDLEELFLMDGITSYKASKLVEIDYKTAKTYFVKWSKQLTNDDSHETWVDRNTRVCARVLEGLANKIYEIMLLRKRFRKRLEKIMDKIESLEKSSKKDASTKIEKLESKVESYERMVRMNITLEAELQQQYAMIEITPPPKEILEAELEKIIKKRLHQEPN